MDDHVLPRLFSSAIWTRGLLAVLLAANLCAPVAAAETPTAMGFLDSARARTSRLESVHLSADFQIRRLATNSGLETGLEGTFEYWSAGGKSRTEIRFDGRRSESFGNIAVASDGRSVEVFFPDLDLLVQRSATEPRPLPLAVPNPLLLELAAVLGSRSETLPEPISLADLQGSRLWESAATILEELRFERSEAGDGRVGLRGSGVAGEVVDIVVHPSDAGVSLTVREPSMDHFVQTEIVKFSDREASRGGFPSEVQITAWPARSDPTSLMLDFSMRVRSLEVNPKLNDDLWRIVPGPNTRVWDDDNTEFVPRP